MRKLRLNLEQLAVDTFQTATSPADEGTVFGEQCTCRTACTCPGCPTCDNTQCNQGSCGDTCDWTCPASCAFSCAGSCWYTNCASNPTCDPSGGVEQCCLVG